MKTSTQTQTGCIEAVFFGQAGFLFRLSDGFTVAVDLYLSDCCLRYFGFKRLMPYLADPSSLELDVLLATHAHYDHFDPDSVPILLSCPRTKLIAAWDVRNEAKRLGLEEKKIIYLREGDSVIEGSLKIEALPCDHGKDTPDAIGLLLQAEGKRIVITGDTCFHEEYFTDENVQGADMLILPINGNFGNMNEEEGARAVCLAKPKIAVPCHYWNFAEHGGNPAKFTEAMKISGTDIPYLLMRPGETIRI